MADPSRRLLLDALRSEGDQTLTQLCDRLPMSRQAVTKHLGVLHDARLVTVRKVGRSRVHSLDADPLRGVADWLAGYAAMWDHKLQGLERHLKENP